jgi:RNA recognition motif-containing protein
MVGVKVFVGNLSFKTTEAELAEAFKAVSKIVNAHIITTPSNRSKGYGFVEFETKAEAEKAVAALNKKEIGGRPINVELARPQEEASTTTNTTTTTTTSNNNAPRTTRAPRVRAQGGQGETRERSNFKTGAPRVRKERAPRTNNNNNTGSGKAEVTEEQDDGRREVRRRPRRYQQRRTEEEEQTTEEDKTPSKTMLFVANLAWKVTDESFTAFLKNEGLKFKSANVVITRNGRSRGYGFINCDNTEEQNRAMEILNKRELDGRPLNVKVANASSETPRTPSTIAPSNNNATTTTTTATTPSTQPAPETK